MEPVIKFKFASEVELLEFLRNTRKNENLKLKINEWDEKLRGINKYHNVEENTYNVIAEIRSEMNEILFPED